MSALTIPEDAPVMFQLLAPHDRIKFPETGNRWWTVQVCDKRWAIATRQAPFKEAGEFEYTIIDQSEGIRGACNLIGYGYEDGTYSTAQLVKMLAELQLGRLEVSSRNRVKTQISATMLAEKRLPDSFLTMGNGSILRCHPEEMCFDKDEPCSVHRPSAHHMRTWPMRWRADRGLLERICTEHRTGHPDPDDLAYHERCGRAGMDVHGCCGCCWDPDRPRLVPIDLEPAEEQPRSLRMPLADFQALGFLHEVNRLVLHPAGLAMSVERDDTGDVTFAGIIDRREDPEGMLFAELEPHLIESVAEETALHAPYRRALIGQVIQTEDLTSEQIGSPEPTWEDDLPAPEPVCFDLPEHEYLERSHSLTCGLPPRGWFCLLIPGHSGPCPTYARWWKKIEMRVRTGVWWP